MWGRVAAVKKGRSGGETKVVEAKKKSLEAKKQNVGDGKRWRKKKRMFFTPFSNVFLLNGSKKNPPFFSAPDSAPCGGVPGRVQGRIFFTSCISSPPSPFVFHFGHLYLFTYSISTAFVCSPPAFEDGAAGVSREDTRGTCLRRAM